MGHTTARTLMVDTQIRPADVTDYAVIRAFLEVPREVFIPQNQKALAYAEVEIGLDSGRKMMSPRSFSRLVQLARPRVREDVLLVGAGLGYEAAILSQLVETIFVVEEDPVLLKAAEANWCSASLNNIISQKGKFSLGLAKSAPYDLIIFNGAVEAVPEIYFTQLKPKGRIIAVESHEGVHSANIIEQDAAGRSKRVAFQAFAPMLMAPVREDKFQFV